MNQHRPFSNMLPRIVELIARAAAGLKYDVKEYIASESIAAILDSLISELTKTIVEENEGVIRCGLCGRGPFTRKGLYLHLKRVHARQIEELVLLELEHRVWVMKNKLT
ncbi:MAG TPA: hypothetical protein EYP08_01925 [Pyrodictiaceae archaeon]|nr:hypothetical protein [Pyrodictiaceae archaeon]HIP85465.1 hypothetical protein [Pyrodictium sp.]HIQ10916.1 hypothetical protein [Pyrodictium sp.]HIQ55749.1 hypothetical protein [Pyrodictium sp.]